tara:strand:+ start:38505 stop:39854 length:1350 start_codon:yes stop_codon:yes gene_type:complete
MNKSNNVLYGNFDEDYITITRGEGVYVFDENNKKYLDAAGGVCVVNIGHGVKEIQEVVSKQVKELAYTYGGTTDNIPRQKLAKKLDQWAPPGMGNTKTIFSSSGGEANEAALKLAYQYHYERGNYTKRKVIGRWQSYHGNTVATLSMSGRTTWRRSNSSLLLDFPHISPPYCYRCSSKDSHSSCAENYANELEKVIKQEGPENISSFIAEPIIGTSMSAVVPPEGYYEIVRKICDKYDVLFISDEVMCGLGRTGKNWGIDHWNVSPDIITTSKGLGGGYSPIGATILAEDVWGAFSKGSRNVSHSSTYGGNPLSCSVGLAVIDYIEKHNLVNNAKIMGDRLLSRLKEELYEVPYVGDVRGKGLLVGVEIVADKESKIPFDSNMNIGHLIEAEARDNGLLILAGVTGLVDGVDGDHVEIVPPYIIDQEHIEFIVSTLRKSIINVLNKVRT